MLHVHWLAPLFSFQKYPAVYSVLCIPAQILVVTTFEDTGNFFLLGNPQAICCVVFYEGTFFLLRSYITVTKYYVSEGYIKKGFHAKIFFKKVIPLFLGMYVQTKKKFWPNRITEKQAYILLLYIHGTGTSNFIRWKLLWMKNSVNKIYVANSNRIVSVMHVLLKR
jgi:hypothetical protein